MGRKRSWRELEKSHEIRPEGLRDTTRSLGHVVRFPAEVSTGRFQNVPEITAERDCSVAPWSTSVSVPKNTGAQAEGRPG
jgi:hypothetical protein